MQLFRVQSADSTLANGNGGDFINNGVLDGCYPASSYGFLVDFVRNPGVVASDIVSWHFDGDTCGTEYAEVKYYTTPTCSGTQANTLDLTLGQVSNGYLIRCWCKNANAPSGDDSQYDMQSMNPIPTPAP